ncbi:MAG: IS116/IS110/IS902-like transposase [Bryobacterales bacterium]|nr:IS116/IS110/IS902-like transposase [Bryobacterales bacterium]
MDVVYARCCGVDVHKESIAVCVLIREPGQPEQKLKAHFSTVTAELLRCADWLASLGVTHVGMESTGVYWKPIWNLWEGLFQLMLANAAHLKRVPGRKTDDTDCEWIAQLLQHGLLPSSFVPGSELRDLRELTRYRSQLVGDHGRVVNRIQKVLEDANIKLASVASDVVGKSGRLMLEAMITGQTDAAQLAGLARGLLRRKKAKLELALEGRLRPSHRYLLQQYWEQLQFLEQQLASVEQQIDTQMPGFREAATLLDTIPGIDGVAAWGIIGEIGADMRQFPSAQHLASWAGLCPGNHQSAGKRLSGKTRKGSRWLRQKMCQAAWAASRTKNSYLSVLFHRLAARRGRRRAIVAVAHTLLVICYHLLQRGCTYQDLGADYFLRANADNLRKYHIKRLQQLGFEVHLTSPAAA